MRKVVLAGALVWMANTGLAAEVGEFGQGHMGLGYGLANLDFEVDLGSEKVSMGSSPQLAEVWWKGYLNRYVALEGRFGVGTNDDESDVSLGSFSANTDVVTWEIDHYAAVNLVFQYPFGKVAPRLSVGYNKVNLKVNLKDFGSLSDTDGDVYVGIGADIQVSPKWGVALDFSDHYGKKDDGVDASITSFRMGIYHTY
ncbi:outer membrane beta-barrel protein [Hahella sp. SMD15-11]|uniref:Outer membrane beta-barrel protein n=1 Tax=Thermohahella caldifontis TaxID=3142973 RepID=A0AB39UVL0_9GAMM